VKKHKLPVSGMKQQLSLQILLTTKVKKYNKQLLACKFDKWDKMDHFLKHKLSRFNRNKKDLNSLLLIKKIESIIFKFPRKNTQIQMILLEDPINYLIRCSYSNSVQSFPETRKHFPTHLRSYYHLNTQTKKIV
jgi:hypothetical protein